MQTTVSPSQTFTVITSQQQKPSKSNVIEHYPHKQALVLGLLQVCIGLMCIVLQTVALIIEAHASSAGTGIWCGIPYMVAGVLGILSSRTKNRSLIIACMVVCICSAILLVLPLVIASTIGYIAKKVATEKDNLKINLYLALLVLPLLEFVLTILTSIVCCNGVCCGYRPQASEIILTGQGSVTSSQGTQQVLVVQQSGTNVIPVVQHPITATPNGTVVSCGYYDPVHNSHRTLPPIPSTLPRTEGDGPLYLELEYEVPLSSSEQQYKLDVDPDGYLQPVESSGSLIPLPEADDGYLDMNPVVPSQKDYGYLEMDPRKESDLFNETHENPAADVRSNEALNKEGVYQPLQH